MTEPGVAAERDGIRLQKLLERAGLCSRRGAAEFLRGGIVTVNGQVVREPGFRVLAGDLVAVDGLSIDSILISTRPRTLMLNKPRGLLCSVSSGQGATIYECLHGIKERIVPAGRLDKESEGLLILSNDGELINRITHPSFGHCKEYLVTASGKLSSSILRKLNSSFQIDGYRTRPANVMIAGELHAMRDIPRFLLSFTLHEGRNRQIRKMCEMCGLRVERLLRTAINSLRLPADLGSGHWRDLSRDDMLDLERFPQ